VRALVVVIAAAGCSKGPSPELREEVATFFDTMDHDPSTLPELGVALATRDDLHGELLDDVPVVELGPGQLVLHRRFEAKRLDDLGGLARELDAITASLATAPLPRRYDRSGIALAIAGDTPWQRVADALGAIEKAGFVHPSFVFVRTPKTPPPPRSKISDDIDKILVTSNAADKAAKLAQLLKGVIGDCRELAQAFGSVAGVEGGDRTAMLLGELAHVVRTADCKVDLPCLRSLMWAVSGNPHPHALLALVLDANASPLAIDGKVVWRDANKQLPAASGHVHVVAR
jgi:hypothetical protein